jgi:ureidoglycolate lyase
MSITIIAEPLSATAFLPFGTVLEAPREPGRTMPVPVVENRRYAAPTTVTLIRLAAVAGPLRIDRMERHPQSGQCFIAMAGARLMVAVASATPSGDPDPAGIHVFIAAPNQSFTYHCGVWHAALAALDAPATVASFLNRDGSAADAIIVPFDAAIEVVLP